MRHRRLPGLLAFLSFLALAAAGAGAQRLYWEAPRPLVEAPGRFPALVALEEGVLALWQESETLPGGASGRAWLSKARRSGGAWTVERRFAGPWEFGGEESSLFSAARDGRGRIGIAVAGGDGGFEILVSEDGGATFARASRIRPGEAAVGPRLFPSAAGGWLLFATQGYEIAFAAPVAGGGADPAAGAAVPAIDPLQIGPRAITILVARSADGEVWSDFAPLVGPEAGLSQNFLPTAIPAGSPGSPLDLVVFQSLVTGAGERPRSSFQLFRTASGDGGATWGRPTRVTDFPDPVIRERNEADNFDNQRPTLSRAAGKIWLAWERNPLGGRTQAYAMNLGADGLPDPKSVDRVSTGQGSCVAPEIVELGGAPAALWYDNRRGGNRVYLAPRRGIDWADEDVSGAAGGEASFARAATSGGAPVVLWQSGAANRDRVFLLEPDRTAAPPSLAALDWSPGTRSRRESVTARIDFPQDSSGIEGYAWSWSRDPSAEPARRLMALTDRTRTTETATEDGTWYLAVAVRDFAGNWSRTARLRYDRDRTPPPPPIIASPPVDERGYLLSNTFTMEWVDSFDEAGKPPEDVAGYTWELRRVGDTEATATARVALRAAPGGLSLPGLTAYEAALVSRAGPPLPPPSILGVAPRAAFRNVDDGYYLFSAASIDRTGNIGPAATLLLRADRFVPYTEVAYVDSRRDDFGRTALRVFGRGFLTDGLVERIVLDADGRAPFDLERERAAGGFRLASDRELVDLSFEDLAEGRYRVGLYHPTRGWYWTGPLVAVDASGTLKFGLDIPAYVPSWRTVAPGRPLLDAYDALLLAAALFSVFGIVFALGRAFAAVREAELVRLQVLALVTGGPMPGTVVREAAGAARRRVSMLGVKFTLTIALLVIFVVLILSVSLGVFMTRAKGTDLATGLKDRSTVLLESVASGGRSYLPSQNLLELGSLPAQAQALPDADYITLTGYGIEASTDAEAVWATNDPDILAKLDGPELKPGSSRLADSLSPRIEGIMREINARASAEVGRLNEVLATLNAEGRALATRLDEASQRRLAEISLTSRDYERQINEKLFAIANASVSSEPAYDPTTAASKGGKYLFYKPILYRRGADQLYYRGMVRLQVDADIIRGEVAKATGNLVRITLIIAAIALGVGVVGASLLALLTVRPIRSVIDAIEKIRLAEDKEELATFTVPVRTRGRDELDDLAEAANALKDDLVFAAKASKALEEGSDIQQLLIPLEDAGGGKKLTVGRLDRPEFEIFGYYKGAKRVSGDYWDFREAGDSGRYYYFIKCDVSGKDVAAAFIMVQVVTMIINHFSDWARVSRIPGFELVELTYRVNDFLNGRGYKGKFAAFTLGVWDAKEGLAHICHAGDNLLHVWNHVTRSIDVVTLHSTPAAGSFPNFMVESTSPYKTVTRRVERGDALLLYTDGIEEAKRYFRDADFAIVPCSDAEKDQRHGNHTGGQDGEEMGFERLAELLPALAAKGRFRIEKQHAPPGNEALNFDFSGTKGSLEEQIMALVAVEKAFRMYLDPSCPPDEFILVDRKIHAFLLATLEESRLFFRRVEPIRTHTERRKPDGSTETIVVEDPNYLRVFGVREDPQYDDLTLLGLARK